MNIKSFRPRFKGADDNGTASWVMATLNEVDHDGDVTLPGAFGEQHFQVVPAHDHTHVPLGKARVVEEGNEAVVYAKFNLAIQAAKDWHEAIKFDLANPPAVQEYSYAYSLRDGGWKSGKLNGQSVRFFQPLEDGTPGVDVFESSPVLRGAGVGTRTLSAKSGMRLHEQVASVLADVDALVERATEVVALRAEKGKDLSDVSAELLGRLAGSLKRLEEILAHPDTSADELRREFARFVALRQELVA